MSQPTTAAGEAVKPRRRRVRVASKQAKAALIKIAPNKQWEAVLGFKSFSVQDILTAIQTARALMFTAGNGLPPNTPKAVIFSADMILASLEQLYTVPRKAAEA